MASTKSGSSTVDEFISHGTAWRRPISVRHSREVKWLNLEVPRSVVDQDLLYSFGALMTICEIRRNDAENRIRKMAATGWKGSSPLPRAVPHTMENQDSRADGDLDLEELARDQIAKVINAKFKGHGLARLVEALLKAQGYTSSLIPESSATAAADQQSLSAATGNAR
jgi:restriction system protein